MALREGILVAALALAACETSPAWVTDENHPLRATKGEDTCGYSEFAHYVGRPLTDLTSRRSTLLRIHRPGEIVLTYLHPPSLAVTLDEKDVILALACD